jgi:hypothetical protein
MIVFFFFLKKNSTPKALLILKRSPNLLRAILARILHRFFWQENMMIDKSVDYRTLNKVNYN